MYTKGKWEAAEHKTGGITDKYWIMAENNPPLIAIVPLYNGGDTDISSHRLNKEQADNANLIAAAPDLMEACKRALDDMQEAGGWSSTMNILQAAIAKAEGK